MTFWGALRTFPSPSTFGLTLGRFEQRKQSFWCNQSPCLSDMRSQLFIADAIKFNSKPPAYSYVRRPEEFLGRGLNQHSLNTNRRRQIDRYMTVVVMVVGKHDIHLFVDKKGRLAVRHFLSRLWQAGTNCPNTL